MLDGEFFGGIPVDALLSVVLCDVISVDEVDLSFRGVLDTKCVRHVSDVFRGLNSPPNALFIEDHDVDL